MINEVVDDCLLIQIMGDDNIPAKNQEFDSILKLSSRAFSNALMNVVGEKLGILEVLHQDVLTARLKREILDLPVRTSHGYAILFEFHSGPIGGNTVIIFCKNTPTYARSGMNCIVGRYYFF